MSNICVHNEFGKLQRVIVGRGDTFGSALSIEVNCQAMERALKESRMPDYHSSSGLEGLRARLDSELVRLSDVLRGYGVNVVRPERVDTQEQMFARDPLIVVKDNILAANFRTSSRVREFAGMQKLLPAHIPLPPGVILEGGDVIPDDDVIFVGVGGQRSNSEAVSFLQTQFPDREIRALELQTADSGQDVLHLDCALGILNEKYALVYPEGFKDPRSLISALPGRDFIVVTREEQQAFATNVLSLSHNTVISRPGVERVNDVMRCLGFNVIEVDMPTVELFGGSFRCATHPLNRVPYS